MPREEYRTSLTAFDLVEEPGIVAYLRSTEAHALREADVLDPSRLVPAGSVRRGCAAVVELAGGKRCFIKRYFRGGLFARVLGDRYLSTRRFVRELAAYECLRAAGLTVPRVLALVMRGTGLFRRVWLVSDFIEGDRSLGATVAGATAPARRRVLRDAGRAARRMHDAGVLHPDLTLENIRVAGDGAILLLDFDRCSFTPTSVRRWWDLFRLHRSAVKAGLWPGPRAAAWDRERFDVASFVVGYQDKTGQKPRVAKICFAAYRVWERAHAVFWKKKTGAEYCMKR